MLASILPGIRDLRAPLVAGYTCLISLWLFIAPDGKAPSGDSGYGLLYRLGQFTGRAGVVAAASVVAYFLGHCCNKLDECFRLYGLESYYFAPAVPTTRFQERATHSLDMKPPSV